MFAIDIGNILNILRNPVEMADIKCFIASLFSVSKHFKSADCREKVAWFYTHKCIDLTTVIKLYVYDIPENIVHFWKVILKKQEAAIW